ncbi:hypothetical protein D3C75_1151490 [compost metagenome]
MSVMLLSGFQKDGLTGSYGSGNIGLGDMQGAFQDENQHMAVKGSPVMKKAILAQ